MDNVAVALKRLETGEQVVVDGQSYKIQSSAAKHKFALQDFNVGDKIDMYGVLVGQATSAIGKGEVITVLNTTPPECRIPCQICLARMGCPRCFAVEDPTFMGYHRADGQVGTRNYWVVIPLVFCENRNIRALQEAFEKELGISR